MTRGKNLLENPEVAEEPPEDNEDEDGAEAPTAQLLGTVPRGDAAQQLAHRDSNSKRFAAVLAGIVPHGGVYVA
jgi:hypothetical protein